MHNLGHAASYKHLLSSNQLLLKKKILQQSSGSVLNPSNIITDCSLFLSGAFDNNDFLEETQSGNNTTHVTSMVLYQEKSADTSLATNPTTIESVENINSDFVYFKDLEEFFLTNEKPLCTFYKNFDSLLDKVISHDSESVWILS